MLVARAFRLSPTTFHAQGLPLRVSVFDPHPVVHEGLARCLPRNGFSVVSQSSDGRECLDTITAARAELVLTDIRMTPVNGFQILDQIQKADLQIPCVVYCTLDDPSYVARSIALGALDYVLKSSSAQTLIRSLHRAAEGEPAGTGIYHQIRERMRARKIQSANPHGLTNRELQVLRHLGFGLSNREIANSLQISVETVKEHVQNILRKQDVNDRTAAAVWAVREGLA